jgi:hypothetical protein
MTELTWKDKQTGATRYGAEIVAQTPDYGGANDGDDLHIAQDVAEVPAPLPFEQIAADPIPAKPRRSRKKAPSAAA